MKRLLLLLLSSWYLLSFGQDPSKGDNTVIVHNIGFSKATSAMLDAGYTFKTKDSTDGVVLSEFMPCPGASLNYCVRIRVKDSVAFITGQWKLTLQVKSGMFASDPNEIFEASYRGWRTGAYKIAFSKLQDLAKKMGVDIAYAKQ